ncbi:MAG: hypothetical protein KDC32_28445, partial [Saprospiraceae bacterium]|nr:hypothetical protein [Saprospiraceae bacterium]
IFGRLADLDALPGVQGHSLVDLFICSLVYWGRGPMVRGSNDPWGFAAPAVALLAAQQASSAKAGPLAICHLPTVSANCTCPTPLPNTG